MSIIFFNVGSFILYPYLALFVSTCKPFFLKLKRQELFSKIYFSYLGNKSKEVLKDN